MKTDVSSAFARCFSSDDGAVVMAHLRGVTVERALGADASVAMLRHLEGQRQLVGYMARMAKIGRGDE
ncbi:MAG: hypothetical protein JKY20_08075 [Alphaproteobacteria bacterium]|nr:hypothetical protein [Alphaproteobacteria bacterium]